MKDWKKALIPSSVSIREVIRTIDTSLAQVAFVVDENQRLLGMVTDRDVRRGILKGVSLDESVGHIMNTNPTLASVNDDAESILEMFRHTRFRHIPIIDEKGCLINVEFLDELVQSPYANNIVVLMAGGTGKRLQPLTDKTPKPLLNVGENPLLETILLSFIKFGFHRFYLSVNYLGKMIEDYFGDGSRWDVKIDYLREEKEMGTAGALSTLPEKSTDPIIVMNGDLLTNVDFRHLLDFHSCHRAQATMCVRKYDLNVPYGVVRIERARIMEIDEKPLQSLFINAGIYILEPELLNLIPKNTFFNMTELFERLVELNYSTVAFPIREYWMDIGHYEDFQRANGDYDKIFG